MIEVEVKLALHRSGATQKDLMGIGFVPGDLVRETDIYFTSDFHDFKKKDEALRIRTCENMTRTMVHSALTYKGPKMDSVSMTRKELETGIEDAGTMRDILLSLGYHELAPVRKLRQYYHMDMEVDGHLPFCIHACLDQVEQLGSFLELEIIVEDEDERPLALERIEELLRDLGYSMADTTRYSYLCMLQGLNKL